MKINALFTKIKKWLKTNIKWSKLKLIGEHKFISSMYIWLFIVPVFANALINIDNSFPITVFSYTFELKTSLPFSWQAFFYSALCFTLANFIRIIFCPKIINEHSDYASFKKSEMTMSHLIEYESEYENNLVVRARELEMARPTADGPEINPGKLFWKIHGKSNNTKKLAQYMASILYLMGFMLISLVIFQNVKNVLLFW